MRHWLLRDRRWALLACLGLWTASPIAAPVADPLGRDALTVRQVSRSVLLAAAAAGPRLVAVGERGIVALSDDTGRTWREAKQVPVSVTLTAVRFVNERLGWATGHGGVVLHTADGGETWSRQLDGVTLAQSALRDAQAMAAKPGAVAADVAKAVHEAELLVKDGPDKPFLDLAFADELHGVVVGAYNLIFATSDGGKTWQSWMGRTDNAKALHLYAVAWKGDDFYVAGEQGLLLHSADAGQTFTHLPLPYQGSWFGLAIQSDRSVVVAGLRGNAYRVGANGEAPTHLGGNGPASFSSVVAAGDDRLLLAAQNGHVFTLANADPAMQAIKMDPLPPLVGLLPLPNQQLLALTVQGVVLLPAGGAK